MISVLRQRPEDLRRQPEQHSESQGGRGYTVKPYLKQTNKQPPPNNSWFAVPNCDSNTGRPWLRQEGRGLQASLGRPY